MSLLPQLPPAPPNRSGWPWTEETPVALYRQSRREWPRITIVTPSFNQADYLEETLRSVLLQNYPNLQFVVCDGGSTDGSVEILRRYEPWLDHWVSEPDRGQSHAINKGLAKADGVWFNWINSDDCLLPGALAKVATAHPTAVVVSGPETTGANLQQTQPLGRTRLGPSLEETIVNHYICQQGVFIRTDVVRALGGVREELRLVMDLDLITRALLQHGLNGVHELGPEPIAFFRQHQGAKTSQEAHRFIEEERRLLAALGRAMQVDPRILDRLVPEEEPVPAYPGAVNALDRSRFAERLALRFWWEETIEAAWQQRDWSTFRRELTDWRTALPHLHPPRRKRLEFMFRLPDFILNLFGRLRRSVD